MILITPAQCRAARALLNWSQPDLAQRCGMNVQTISAFEKESGSPTKTTLQKIAQTLESAGIEFLADNGVSIAENKFYQCDNYTAVLKDVLVTLERGEEALFMRAYGKNNSPSENDAISSLHNKGIKMRALTAPSNDQLRPDREYRYMPEAYFQTTQLTLIYGDKIAMNIDYKEHDARFLTIKSKTLAKAMKAQFEYWWKNGKDIPQQK